MTNALAYTDIINKLPRRTAAQVPARRPGITTTRFSTSRIPDSATSVDNENYQKNTAVTVNNVSVSAIIIISTLLYTITGRLDAVKPKFH